MITLEEYKQLLLSSYTDEEEKEKRKGYLKLVYNDRYLERIISDSYDFIKDIYSSKYLETNTYTKELDNEEPTDTIVLDPSSKKEVDTVYIAKDNKYISDLIVRYTLKETEVLLEDNTLTLKLLTENMSKIKEDLFGTSKVL